jgi:hypothetical protein
LKAKQQTEAEARASDRHPPVPAIDESGIPTTPAVPNPADQQFYPSAAQPVAQKPKTGRPSVGAGDGRR